MAARLRILLALVVLSLALTIQSTSVAAAESFKSGWYRLSYTIDGDSIRVRGLSKDIRLAGVNTPDVGEPYRDEASDGLDWLLDNFSQGWVYLEAAEIPYHAGTDRYRAYVWITISGPDDWLVVQDWMAYTGFAYVDHSGPWKSTKYYRYLAASEAAAKADGCYIWGGVEC